jgi:hypothetical protein
MLGDLTLGRSFEHGTSQGNASEGQWLAMLAAYLPRRYRVAPGFVINAEGRRSRQIDLVIYDDLQSPPLFPHAAGVHLPIESVYAVFEIKPELNRAWLRDAGEKAASVRELRDAGSEREILGGILATSSGWSEGAFARNLEGALARMVVGHEIDLGCAIEEGSFEYDGMLTVSDPDEALIFFVLRLVERLNGLGPAPAAGLMGYVKTLESFQRWL